MTRQRTLIILAAVTGMAAGYVAWLAAACVVMVVTPVNWWAAVWTVVLIAGISAAVVSARRATNPAARMFYRWSPVLPVAAVVYVVILLLVK